jgi:kynurenine aminotransferase
VNGRGRDFKYVSLNPAKTLARFNSSFLRACWFMAIELGVSSIPVSEVSSHLMVKNPRTNVFRKFYCEEHCNIGEAYARFAFCKDLDTLHAAAKRLKNLTKHMKKD